MGFRIDEVVPINERHCDKKTANNITASTRAYEGKLLQNFIPIWQLHFTV